MAQPFGPAGLTIDSSYYSELDLRSFALMLKDPSYCYKYYWLEAIVNLISEGIEETTFDAIIDEMICNAWYSVREFHIHLSGLGLNGEIRDGLERTIVKLSTISDLPSNASKVEIRNAIREHEAELSQSKEQLTHMVPYRALAGFFTSTGITVPWDSVRKMTTVIESFNAQVTSLPYTLGTSPRLRKEVRFHPDWGLSTRFFPWTIKCASLAKSMRFGMGSCHFTGSLMYSPESPLFPANMILITLSHGRLS